MHSAGVLRDALIRGGGAAEGCADVWNAKAHSAWLLHKHTLQDNLKVFLSFSSIVSAVGNVGQSAYGAANRYLDSLMEARGRAGLHGVSVQWPAIRGVGMAAASASSGKMSNMEDWSIDVDTVESVLKQLLLSCNDLSDDRVLTIMPHGILKCIPSDIGGVRHQFTRVQSELVASSDNDTQCDNRSVVNTWSHEDISNVIEQLISTLCDQEIVTDDDQLMDAGLDSLGATELANRLSQEFGVKVSSTILFNYPTKRDLIQFMKSQVGNKSDVNVALGVGTSMINRCENSDVVIVGMSCRLPGDVNSVDALWKMMVNKTDMTSEVSLNRWDTDALIANMEDSDNNVLNRARYGGFLSDEVVESFDAQQFGISDAEASRMDPNQRLLLEVSLEALGDAGYTIESLKGQRIGVFVAASGSLGNGSTSLGDNIDSLKAMSVYDATGSTLSVASGRISYVLGLQGPCMTIDTACSSSLVALHSARRSLQLKECEAAVVVGVSLLTAPGSIACAMAGMTSFDGKCHTFDESANGYCRGEGCGAVVLKRLGDTETCSDDIYAVIRGSAVMQDGKSASLTAPNGLAQEQLMRSALADGGVSAADVGFIEAHGTGTKLGDPIETAAVANVYGVGRDVDNPLYMSSVKANIGHLEAAAGMAGLMSAILALQRGQAPPNANLRVLNEKVAMSVSQTPAIQFPMEVTPIHRQDGRKLMAAVSAFGYSGSIAHVILEESPAESLRVIEYHASNSSFHYSNLLLHHALIHSDIDNNDGTYPQFADSL